MKIEETRLPGVLLISPKVFHDERGFFMETWKKSRFEEAGIDAAFNYKKVDHLIKEVGKHCPGGIDVYFKNVGGELEKCHEEMKYSLTRKLFFY